MVRYPRKGKKYWIVTDFRERFYVIQGEVVGLAKDRYLGKRTYHFWNVIERPQRRRTNKPYHRETTDMMFNNRAQAERKAKSLNEKARKWWRKHG